MCFHRNFLTTYLYTTVYYAIMSLRYLLRYVRSNQFLRSICDIIIIMKFCNIANCGFVYIIYKFYAVQKLILLKLHLKSIKSNKQKVDLARITAVNKL